MICDLVRPFGIHSELGPQLRHYRAGMHIVGDLADQAVNAKSGRRAFRRHANFYTDYFAELIVLWSDHFVHNYGQRRCGVGHFLQHDLYLVSRSATAEHLVEHSTHEDAQLFLG